MKEAKPRQLTFWPEPRPVGPNVRTLPVAQLARAVEAYMDLRGASWADVARWAGYGNDTSKLKRDLGLMPRAQREQARPLAEKRIQPRTALRLIEAIGADPVDIGL